LLVPSAASGGRGASLRPRGGGVSGSLLRGGSFGGSSAAFCGYASWLAWWWISGVSMGIPSSLLSISGLEALCYETHRFASRCLARIRGAPFEGSVRPMFGGGLYVFVLELDDALGELVLRRFPSARVDAGGFVEDLPASFRVFCGARGVRWRLRLWRRLATKRCRRRGVCCGVFGGVCGAFGWCWRRRVFYASCRGASRRGCKLGEDRGTPRGNVFCGWVPLHVAGGCLGLWLMRGRLCRWARFWGRVLACGRWGRGAWWSRGWL